MFCTRGIIIILYYSALIVTAADVTMRMAKTSNFIKHYSTRLYHGMAIQNKQHVRPRMWHDHSTRLVISLFVKEIPIVQNTHM